jgi:aminomethyltransferase
MLASALTRGVRASSGTNMGAIRAFSQFPNHGNKVNAPFQASNSPVPNTDVDTMFKNNKLRERRVPIQLRNTGDGGLDGNQGGGLENRGSRMLIDTRLRKGPYWHLSQEAGAWCYSVYNKIYHPRAYIRPEDGGLMEEYKYLTEHVTMWNVAVERQVMVKGPDSGKFVDYVITRQATKICPVGKAKYVILTNQYGGILNDPILLRVQEDEWWFSLADSDIAMYLQGVNHDGRFDVDIHEIDYAPVQIQGPKAPALMADLFGADSAVTKMKYYDCIWAKINGVDCVVTATGFSTELGYEIYLKDATANAEKMWNYILEKGEAHNLKVIAPGHHRRIEAGLMSYGADIDIEINPFECGLGWQCDFDRGDWIGKKALEKVKASGVTHKLAGLRMGGKPIEWYAADFYHVFNKEKELIGYVSSAWFSPEQGSNIALAMLPIEYTEYDTEVEVALPKRYSDNPTEKSIVTKTPFKQPAAGNEGRGLNMTGSKL